MLPCFSLRSARVAFLPVVFAFVVFAFVAFALVVPRVRAQSPVPEGATVERVASGFQFVEGPVWQGGAVLFSDIPAGRVYRWTPGGGAEVFVAASRNSNGLAFDADGRLLLAQHGTRRVARIEADGAETALATHYEGARLNSPNDLTLHPDGSIYFTDPPWGIQPWQAELDFTGVYRIAPDGSLHLLVDSLFYPNGIAFSPDYATLYVSTSHEQTVVAYDVEGHGLSNGRVFARTPGRAGEAADGMKTDAAGRLYVAGPAGVWIFGPDGELLDRVDVPEQTTNLAWGDADGETLYITSGTGLYRLRIGASPTAARGPDALPAGAPLLESVHPNPASGVVSVTYHLRAPSAVEVAVLDALGRTVRVLDAGTRPAGTHTRSADVAGLPVGVYFVRLMAGGQTVARRVVVQR